MLVYFVFQQALLEVVHSLFEEQTSVDNVVMKIMQRAQALLQCERCIVMLQEKQEYSPEVSIIVMYRSIGNTQICLCCMQLCMAKKSSRQHI